MKQKQGQSALKHDDQRSGQSEHIQTILPISAQDIIQYIIFRRATAEIDPQKDQSRKERSAEHENSENLLLRCLFLFPGRQRRLRLSLFRFFRTSKQPQSCQKQNDKCHKGCRRRDRQTLTEQLLVQDRKIDQIIPILPGYCIIGFFIHLNVLAQIILKIVLFQPVIQRPFSNQEAVRMPCEHPAVCIH